MLARFLKSHTVYLVCGYTDMRKSIDGLTSIVQQHLVKQERCTDDHE